MFVTCLAVLTRIFSNSMSNVFQKQLTAEGISPYVVNFLMYFGLSICCISLLFKINYADFSVEFWASVIMGGLFGALGNSYLVKALENGELSILAPINSYKPAAGMLFGMVLLHEFPSIFGIAAIALIIGGSYFIFDTQEEGFSLRLLKRSDIRYRIYALIFTAVEAVFIKNVIVLTDVTTSFVMWCFWGMIFTGLLVLKQRTLSFAVNRHVVLKMIFIIILAGLMQYCTNFVFSRVQVSYGLALFQLSSILSVILGWKYFKEKHAAKKFAGSIIMAAGAIILILLK